MSTSVSQTTFRLSVDAGVTTELFVVDSTLNLVQRGIGRLDATLPAGIYKVRALAGRQEDERIVLVNRDTTVEFANDPSFASPAPLLGTSRTHEYHVEAAQSWSRAVHVRAGAGASVFMFARWWTPPNASPAALGHPGLGITLSRWTGEPVADLAVDGMSRVGNPLADPFAGCNVELDPGAYVLRRPTPNGGTLVQTVIASPGWQTQVFVLKRGAAPRPDQSMPDPATLLVDDLSILMNQGGFDPGSQDMKLAELARIALADERRVLSDELRQMAEGKFQNPMLGIFAAHILDLSLNRQAEDETMNRRFATEGQPTPVQLQTNLQASDLNVLVDNLRTLIGKEHPDVEALSLRCPDPARQTKLPLRVAPMLRRSWSLYVAASNDRPALVPTRLWDRISTLTALVPYLAWLPAMDGRREIDAADQVARALAGDTKSRKSAPPAAAVKFAPKVTTARMSVGRVARVAGGSGKGRAAMALLPAESEIRLTVPKQTPETPSARDARRPRMPGSVKTSVSIAHDIPRAALNRAFRRL